MLPCFLLGVALALGQANTPTPGPVPPGLPSVPLPVIQVSSVEAAPEGPTPEEAGPRAYQRGSPSTGASSQPESNPYGPTAQVGTEAPRRALPPPFLSPPLPSGEYQGYPLVGVPYDTTRWPLMKALQGTWISDALNSERINVYGWINASANWSTSKNSNTPDSYWIVPNSVQLDQTILRVERQVDSVQTDHIDWGFRSTGLFGIDYRYMVAGGWGPADVELLNHNRLYGVDFTEQYFDLYVPWVAQGMILRVGRWIACPDIETQFAPDNYLGTHSILFTFDTYTQTGVMATIMLDKQWTVQGCLHSGTDMAPWYRGSLLTGMAGIRWVAQDNNDSVYTVLNSINSGEFRLFQLNGQPAGHDNFNYIVSTWQHRFNERILTKTEGYFMWQFNAPLGGTVSIGNSERFGGGGGFPSAPLIGRALTYGLVNYTMFVVSPKDFITFRNEWWRDEEGERSGFPSTYTSNTIGFTHNFTPEFQIRPEIGYYRSWTIPAFDLGTRKNQVMLGCDVTLRF
jgi:hypothetical protein